LRNESTLGQVRIIVPGRNLEPNRTEPSLTNRSQLCGALSLPVFNLMHSYRKTTLCWGTDNLTSRQPGSMWYKYVYLIDTFHFIASGKCFLLFSAQQEVCVSCCCLLSVLCSHRICIATTIEPMCLSVWHVPSWQCTYS